MATGQPKGNLEMYRQKLKNKESDALKAATNTPGRARPAYPNNVVTLNPINRRGICTKIWNATLGRMVCARNKTEGGRKRKHKSKTRRNRKH